MNHTPGPWYWTGSCTQGTMITAKGGAQIAIWPPQWGTVEQCRNASLIAAAPDMLAALALLVDGDGKPDECPRAMNAARAALAKARGE